MKNFSDLIFELGEYIGEDLKADDHNACCLQINQILKVQIELDAPSPRILLISLITELPPGKFRENILRDGLKANYLAEEKIGTLSYLERENCLVLFHYIFTPSITKEILHENLIKFIERATAWYNAIESGRSSPDSGEIPQSFEKKGSIFGFK